MAHAIAAQCSTRRHARSRKSRDMSASLPTHSNILKQGLLFGPMGGPALQKQGECSGMARAPAVIRTSMTSRNFDGSTTCCNHDLLSGSCSPRSRLPSIISSGKQAFHVQFPSQQTTSSVACERLLIAPQKAEEAWYCTDHSDRPVAP